MGEGATGAVPCPYETCRYGLAGDVQEMVRRPLNGVAPTIWMYDVPGRFDETSKRQREDDGEETRMFEPVTGRVIEGCRDPDGPGPMTVGFRRSAYNGTGQFAGDGAALIQLTADGLGGEKAEGKLLGGHDRQLATRWP
jgi:hypothetical protein